MKQLFVLVIVVALVVLAGCAQQGTNPNQTTLAKPQAQAAVQVPSGKVDIEAVQITTSSPSFSAGDRVTIYPVVKNLDGPINDVQVGLYANDQLVNMFNFDFKEGETKGPMYAWYPKKAGKYEFKIVIDPANKIDITRANNIATTTVDIS